MPGAHTAPGKVLLCIQGKYSGPESSQLSGYATFSRRCRTPKPKNNDDAVMPDDSGMPYLCYESSIGSPESLSLSGLAFLPFQGDGPPVYRPQTTRRESSPPPRPTPHTPRASSFPGGAVPSLNQRPRALIRYSSPHHHYPVQPPPTTRKGTQGPCHLYVCHYHSQPTRCPNHDATCRAPHPLQTVKNGQTVMPGMAYLRYVSNIGSPEPHKVSGLANPFTRQIWVSNDDLSNPGFKFRTFL